MASIRIIGKILAEQPGNGRCHWLFASGIYRFDFVVGVSFKDLWKSSNINGLQAASKAFILN